jgi:hypothetical protein
MGRILGLMFGMCVFVAFDSTANAQGAAYYPPASGHMQFVPPSYPAPGAVGGQYVETYPSFMGSYGQPGTYFVQPGVPYANPTPPAAGVRVRGRNVRPMSVYSRGYGRAPAPYATQLPQGQLYWPGNYAAPGYMPLSRYQTYGAGYGVSPYGSNFYGGYYQGHALGY